MAFKRSAVRSRLSPPRPEIFGFQVFFFYRKSLSKKWAARRPPNMVSISNFRQTVHSQYLQDLAPILMEHPILKKSGWLAIIKLQKRSESNVLINLTSNSVESRGYANDGTRQVLKPLMSEIRGFVFAIFPPGWGGFFIGSSFQHCG